jgi:predicted transcriptional regulator
MIKSTKLQETELQELKDFQTQSETLIAQLGQLGFKKLQIEREEQFLKQQYTQIISSEAELSKRLKETYGDVSIDLKTGEITYS